MAAFTLKLVAKTTAQEKKQNKETEGMNVAPPVSVVLSAVPILLILPAYHSLVPASR